MMQLSILDAIISEQNAENGLKRAVDKADRDLPGWSEITYSLFKNEFLPNVNGPFMIEDFRSFLAMKEDYQFPENLRSFGVIPRKAAIEGLIRCTGTMKVKNAKANRANANVYVKI